MSGSGRKVGTQRPRISTVTTRRYWVQTRISARLRDTVAPTAPRILPFSTRTSAHPYFRAVLNISRHHLLPLVIWRLRGHRHASATSQHFLKIWFRAPFLSPRRVHQCTNSEVVAIVGMIYVQWFVSVHDGMHGHIHNATTLGGGDIQALSKYTRINLGINSWKIRP